MSTDAKIRVVLADDSAIARGMLRFIFEEDGGFEVVGEALNGQDAVRLAKEQHPDLITMDLEMPVMSGFDAIREIMCSRAVPILVVSSVADAKNAYTAVSLGAVDVVNKPSRDPADWVEFLAKARMAAKIRVITHLRTLESLKPPAELNSLPQPAPVSAKPSAWSSWPPPPCVDECAARSVFVIACSTGGPQALATILPRLPVNFPSPVLIAQHISDGFAAGMAEWLNVLCPLPVTLACAGEPLRPGRITLAPSEYHLQITTAHRLALIERAAQDIYHPSCDLLLESVAKVYQHNSVGIILTGMGKDGVRGMRAIHGAGGHTLAQDEATSVIFGMNRIAIEEGVVEHVVPLEAIPEQMLRLAGMDA
ncbi:chemotaxis-specific protein-glutamate methyltransferase CheB [Thiorhodospira sibirica]|uniref:chemotaxis-specific protein-glutamate methyltransferase CheB n=1 Tax=Thiorhodospira sibirica TaxID=154347 RepID=UPI00022C22AD|nr:chemotaxis-specific protein-glutamate methyltransferase CheB [Thiorhodospira sibirica]